MLQRKQRRIMAAGAGIFCLALGVMAGARFDERAVGAETRAAESGPVSTRASLVVKSGAFVETPAISVTEKLLDRARGLVPKNYDGEGGRCEFNFRGDFSFESAPPTARHEGDEFVATMVCQVPKAKVTLGIVLWLPAQASAWLTDHEETHREISERVYSEGVESMSALLKGMAGRTFEARGKSEAEAIALVRKLPVQEFNEANDRLFVTRARLLNDRFDTITRHGLRRDRTNAAVVEQLFKATATTIPDEDH